MGISGGAGAGRAVCVAGISDICRLRTPSVTESYLPSTESPASLIRLRLALRCSAAAARGLCRVWRDPDFALLPSAYQHNRRQPSCSAEPAQATNGENDW